MTSVYDDNIPEEQQSPTEGESAPGVRDADEPEHAAEAGEQGGETDSGADGEDEAGTSSVDDPSVKRAHGSLFTVDVPVYEGPMDLLLFVVRQRQVDLLELPLSGIANDFLDYARAVERLDLDLAGEVIFIASLLLRMKVRALLPREEEEAVEEPEDVTRDEDLEEVYREIVAAARQLAQNEEKQRDHFPRGDAAGRVQVDETGEMLRDVSLVNLAEAFREVTRRMDSTPVHQLALFKISVEDQSRIILDALAKRDRIGFEELIEGLSERIEVVVTFLSVLELIRYGRIRITQEQLFGTIWILRGPQFSRVVPRAAEEGEE